MPTGDARTRHLPPIHPGVFVVVDGLLLAAVGFAVVALQDQLLPSTLLGQLPSRLLPVAGFRPAWTLLHALLLPVVFVALGQYRMLQPGVQGWSFPRLVLAFLALDLVFLSFLFLIGFAADRVFVLASFAGGIAVVAGMRAIVNNRLRKQVLSGQRVRNALLVGASPGQVTLAHSLVAQPILGRRVMGFAAHHLPDDAPTGTWTTTEPDAARAAIVENSLRQPRHLWVRYDAPDDAARQRLLDGLGIEEVYADATTDHLQAWLAVCQTRGIDFHLVPTVPADLGVHPKPWSLGGTVLLDLHGRPMSTLGWWGKRAIDIVVGSLGLIAASPILLVAAIAIKIENPKSPVFYGGKRVGWKGRHFKQWKLATMRPDADSFRDQLQAKNAREGPWFQLDEENDPRISKVGKFLRKYSLNDLPQFWNVVRGNMSMVGPRPLAADEASRFVKFDFRYYQCFDVKPGITGLWQVSNRMDPSFEYRFKLDMEYVTNWSVWLDLKLMVMTPVAMMKGGR